MLLINFLYLEETTPVRENVYRGLRVGNISFLYTRLLRAVRFVCKHIVIWNIAGRNSGGVEVLMFLYNLI